MLQWTQDKREVLSWYYSYKSKQRCENCGAPGDMVNLTFHHIDPASKRFNISAMVMKGLSVARIKEEMKKCKILCRPCHDQLHPRKRVLRRMMRRMQNEGKQSVS